VLFQNDNYSKLTLDSEDTKTILYMGLIDNQSIHQFTAGKPYMYQLGAQEKKDHENILDEIRMTFDS
jgi:hypothetical protein